MSNTLLGLLSASLLSLSSLIVVLVRMSPLLDPAYALPFLFLTVFFTVGTIASVLLIAFHVYVLKTARPAPASAPGAGDAPRALRSSLRRGFLFAAATCLILLLHLLHVLTWWNAGLVYLVLILVELAVEEE